MRRERVEGACEVEDGFDGGMKVITVMPLQKELS